MCFIELSDSIKVKFRWYPGATIDGGLIHQIQGLKNVECKKNKLNITEQSNVRRAGVINNKACFSWTWNENKKKAKDDAAQAFAFLVKQSNTWNYNSRSFYFK